MGLIYHVIHHVSHARSLVLSEEDIEDIAAEVFLAIVDDDYAILRRFAGKSSLPTYLTVISRRVCVKEVVKRQRNAKLGHATAHRAATDEGDSASDVEPLMAAEEVQRILDDLPDREAQVIRLYHLKSLNYRQIGKQLGIPENSVGPILAKARDLARKTATQRQ
jgi:RNA polymerase sigma-70 factor (ECF subfamily)